MNALEALHKWSCETPNKNVWTFLNDKGDITESYTYKVSVYFPTSAVKQSKEPI